MKLSVLPLVLAALSVASASPIRIYVLSSETSGVTQAGNAFRGEADPMSYIRWGMAAANAKQAAEPKEGDLVFHGSQAIPLKPGQKNIPTRKHGCTGGIRRKMFKLSNWLREKVGLPPITRHHHRHGHHGHQDEPKGHHRNEAHHGESAFAVDGKPEVGGLRLHHHHHHHMRPSSFGGRLQKGLLSLGPWEGRAVAFVLGCGIGSLLRMFYVLMVLVSRAVSSPREEEIVVDVLYEDEDAPPSYADEKAPLVEEVPQA